MSSYALSGWFLEVVGVTWGGATPASDSLIPVLCILWAYPQVAFWLATWHCFTRHSGPNPLHDRVDCRVSMGSWYAWGDKLQIQAVKRRCSAARAWVDHVAQTSGGTHHLLLCFSWRLTLSPVLFPAGGLTWILNTMKSSRHDTTCGWLPCLP